MSQITRVRIDVTTDASGDATKYTPILDGYLHMFRYVPDGTNPLATGADIDLTGDQSGMVYVNQDNIGTSAYSKLPRAATCDETGAASLYAAGGEPVEDRMLIAGERLKLVVANGGNAKSGAFHLWIAQ